MNNSFRQRATLLSLALVALCVPAFAQAAAQNNEGMTWTAMILRWAHVLFGIIWIGHLYYFNFVQGGFEGKLTAELKKVVIPENRPRALYWFRWGAAWTWVTGVLLLGPTAKDGGLLTPDEARSFLRRLGVPLEVWSIGKRSPEAQRWKAETLITAYDHRDFDDVVNRLLGEVDRQRIVWFEGAHMPHEVVPSRLAHGVRLAQ